MHAVQYPFIFRAPDAKPNSHISPRYRLVFVLIKQLKIGVCDCIPLSMSICFATPAILEIPTPRLVSAENLQWAPQLLRSRNWL